MNTFPPFFNVFFIPFHQDPQWREKQTQCQQLVQSIQKSLSGRNSKIVLVVIQDGSSLPPVGDAVSEDRCNSLCNACGLQLQTSLFILQSNEQLQGCCIKLDTKLYEMAQNYYVVSSPFESFCLIN